MPEAKPRADAETDDERGLESPLELDLDALRARGDVPAILALARAYRSGAVPGGRDLARCLEAYRAAAELGSADAEYAVALFCMTGGVVPQDWKEGTTRLRAAAEKGSVPAKVYLGNLYELGIHYRADPEKADVWYRNAARGARITAAPGSDEYARELAELGCVRYVLSLSESGAVDGDDRARLMQRARAHGYGLRPREAGVEATTPDRPTFLDALQSAEPTPGAAAQATAAPAPSAAPPAPLPEPPARPKGEESAAPKDDPSKARASIALGAFGYALLFMVAGLGAAYAALLGARELVARGQPLPGLGARTDLVFPIVLAVVGVLPTWLVYRFGTVVKALVIGGAMGGIGWVAWGTGQATLAAERAVQALVFGLTGFVAGLCVLGFLGGTKKQPPRARRTRHLSE